MWGVHVYHDYLDPDQCEVIPYYFDNENTADQFRVQAVATYDTIFIGPSYCVLPSSVSTRIFYDSQDALDDLRSFLDRENRSKYIYQNDIQQMPLLHLHCLIYQSECAYLKEENRNLKVEVQNLKKKIY